MPRHPRDWSRKDLPLGQRPGISCNPRGDRACQASRAHAMPEAQPSGGVHGAKSTTDSPHGAPTPKSGWNSSVLEGFATRVIVLKAFHTSLPTQNRPAEKQAKTKRQAFHPKPWALDVASAGGHNGQKWPTEEAHPTTRPMCHRLACGLLLGPLWPNQPVGRTAQTLPCDEELGSLEPPTLTLPGQRGSLALKVVPGARRHRTLEARPLDRPAGNSPSTGTPAICRFDPLWAPGLWSKSRALSAKSGPGTEDPGLIRGVPMGSAARGILVAAWPRGGADVEPLRSRGWWGGANNPKSRPSGVDPSGTGPGIPPQ